MPSTKKIIKNALRDGGVSEDRIDQYDEVIRSAASALDQSPNEPARDVLTRAVGGHSDARSYIGVVAEAVTAARANGNGSQASAPALAEATVVQPGGQPDLLEIADRLREFARRAGLPSRQVEEALTYAGLTVQVMAQASDAQDSGPNEDQAQEDEVGNALDLLTSAVQALRGALQ